jgi:hypothetical protein
VILFYSPEAGVTKHFMAQSVLALTLRELGHRVMFVRCFELFSRCPVMDMVALPYTGAAAERHETCLRCASASMAVLDDTGLEYTDLRALLTPEMTAAARQAVLDAPDDLRQLEFDGIPFGRYCVGDLILATKISDLEHVAPDIRAAWLTYIESGIRSYLLVAELCRRLPVHRFIHCEDYALLISGRLAAMRANVPCVTTVFAQHGTLDGSRYLLAPDGISAVIPAYIAAWTAWRDLALTERQVADVMDDAIVRLRGDQHHVFSPPKSSAQTDVRTKLGVPSHRRIIAAFTSSLDELLGEDMVMDSYGIVRTQSPQPFADQIEWLQALAEYAEARDDVHLVVRVHPREGARGRTTASQHLAELRARFDKPWTSCTFVWPEDALSSYDIGEAADVALISWSTIGIELARMGVPAMSFTNGIGAFPVDDFMRGAADRASYFEQLEQLLDSPGSIETIAQAFRWYQVAQLGAAVDLGDVVAARADDPHAAFRLPREARAIEQVLLGETDMLSLNHARQLSEQTTDAPLNEQRALRRQLRRLIHFCCTGQDETRDAGLIVNPDRSTMSSGTRVIHVDGGHVEYTAERRTYARFSPLCARLAPLCAGPSS